MTVAGQPVADGLYDIVDGEVRLIAGRPQDGGPLAFPFPQGSEAARYEPVLLPATGTLWSWTVQRFAPKAPYDGPSEADFTPYGVAYVQLGDMLIVEGRMIDADLGTLRIGQPMRVVTEAYASDAGGAPIETYAFAPIGAQS